MYHDMVQDMAKIYFAYVYVGRLWVFVATWRINVCMTESVAVYSDLQVHRILYKNIYFWYSNEST